MNVFQGSGEVVRKTASVGLNEVRNIHTNGTMKMKPTRNMAIYAGTSVTRRGQVASPTTETGRTVAADSGAGAVEANVVSCMSSLLMTTDTCLLAQSSWSVRSS